ncbi:disease resistance protein RPV1-like [Rhododendron vialii]|uniref:disease resistance protein RPV1-like n=1 Tax=Rhododendron vialii TaxID=182163 RepID=UPI00265F250C|nr:disease resistance protein RPV1-like [Rhododendron vialii]
MAAACAKGASCTFSPNPPQCKYDVFLSFRGVDTRHNFTSHLLAALERHGFRTFKDNTGLNRGEYISTELLKAIEESRISIVILSKNYAGSQWCLDELVKIMKCKKTLQQIVMPIFYDVDPSGVRAQNGSNLVEELAKHEEHFKAGSDGKLDKWREALTEVANLSGWNLPMVANGDETKLIQKSIEEVRKRLDFAHLHVADHQVGLESHLQKLNLLLNMESDDVRIVAVWGIGGIGKTTIAKKLYNLIQHNFEGSSFIANVGETSKQPNGLVILQEQLLSDIIRNGTHDVRNFHQGIEVIKRRAFCQKVLLVLDDVDDVQQLKALAINRGSLSSGSRIVITTRDMSSLSLLKVDKIYAPEELTKDESLELFSWHAFKKDHPTDNYLGLSNQVVGYTGGLPLALEVLGSFLCGKSIPEWKSAIVKLEKIPHDDIQRKLKISFDSLSDEVKELFLDVTCFFLRRDRDFTITVLEGCNFFPAIGIRVLADRCLIKYEPTSKQLVMHDLLRDMGREIVRQESIKEPGRLHILFSHYAIDRFSYQGTEAVEGLVLNFPELNGVQVNAKAFEKMNRMRLLNLNYVHLSVGYEHSSTRLVWLCWNGFPLKHVPSNLHMENLVTLDLCYSKLKQVWKGTKVSVKLKFLYLSHCYYLPKTPDFSGLNNLKELLLNDCIRLVEVDESIRCLHKLVVLDMRNCRKLWKLPFGIGMLKSLEYLDFSGCRELGKLAGLKGSPSKSRLSFLSSWTLRTKKMDSIGLSLACVQGLSCLKRLSIADCNLSHLPGEIGSLISLETLTLDGNNLCTLPDSVCNLVYLKELSMDCCNVSHLPAEVERLISLEVLDLGGNSFTSLPDSFRNLSNLWGLYLGNCTRLESIPEIPSGLLLVDASLCTSLESVPTARCKVSMCFWGAKKFVKNNFATIVIERIQQYKILFSIRPPIGIILPGVEVPNWFEYQNTGGSYLSFAVPPLVTWKIMGLMLCVIMRPTVRDEFYLWSYLDYHIGNKTTTENFDQRPANGFHHVHAFSVPLEYCLDEDEAEDKMCFLYIPLACCPMLMLESGDEVEISIESRSGVNGMILPFMVKKCGLKIIYEDDGNTTEKEKTNITETN